MQNILSQFLKWVRPVTFVYTVLVLAWAATYWLKGDWGWRMFLLNSFAVYYFLPAPFLLVLSVVVRSKIFGVLMGLVIAIGVAFQGWLFLPKFSSAANTNVAPTLSVMTYNTLFAATDNSKLVQTIRHANADVVSLQELTPHQARAIVAELSTDYPYQILQPDYEAIGMGLISKFPLKQVQHLLGGKEAWVGAPIVAELTWHGQTVMVMNAHPPATNYGDPRWMQMTMRVRNASLQKLLAYSRTFSVPVIVPIDMNATMYNDAYKLMDAELVDAWREAGWGFGHTFPGGNTAGGSRPMRNGVPTTPPWLVRIDYIWHTPNLRAVDARVIAHDGQSDHRPMLAVLQMK